MILLCDDKEYTENRSAFYSQAPHLKGLGIQQYPRNLTKKHFCPSPASKGPKQYCKPLQLSDHHLLRAYEGSKTASVNVITAPDNFLLYSCSMGYTVFMKVRVTIITLGLVLGVLVASHSNVGERIQIYRMSSGDVIDLEQVVEEVSRANIILIGEIHDSEPHHQFQLQTIKRLSEADLPIVVGFEMFPQESQETLDRWIAGTVPLDDFVEFYQTHWSQPWPLFRDIFLYARAKRIPLLALNIPRDITQKVRRSGFLSLNNEELKKLPTGLSCNVDEKYMEFIRKAFAAHKNTDKAFVHFCESQLLWDKSMAWYLFEYLGRRPGKKIVVLTGLNHAWKRGIPDQLTQFSGKSNYKVLLPEIPGIVEPGVITLEDADYIFLK